MTKFPLVPILDHLRAEPSRTWSIIITVFGDAIVPRGGSVWLGTLLAFFQELQVADGVVRTAMSRLASDGWLERTRIGRNSYYRLANKGRETFRQAAEQIYTRRAPVWAGYFDLIMVDAGGERSALPGFGSPAPGVWLAPGESAVPDVPGIIRVRAQGDAEAIKALAARSWPLSATAEAYQRFIARFQPLCDALESGAIFSDADAFVARILLIHEYRRIVLRDPILPAEILPADWPGGVARGLCATIYGRLLHASERWLDAKATNEDGATLGIDQSVLDRFQG